MSAYQTPENLAAEALSRAQQHRLCTDDQLQEVLERNIKHSTKALRFQSILILVLFVSLALPTLLALSKGHTVVLALLPVLVAVGGLGRHQWKERQKQCQTHLQAREALSQRDYHDYSLQQALQIRDGLSPLTDNDDWRWRNLSEGVADHPVLGPLWALWLLEKAPIRQCDADVLESALSSEKRAKEWRQSQQSMANQQQRGRAEALTHLPSELVSQVRTQLLGEGLPQAHSGQAKPRF